MKPLRVSVFLIVTLMAISCAASSNSALSERSGLATDRAIEANAYSDYLVARFAAMTNDPKTAAIRYATSVETAPVDSGTSERAVFSSLLAGDYESANKLAKKASETGSQATLVRLTLAVDALKQGDPALAREYIDAAPFAPFNRTVARQLSAWSYAADGQHEVAEEYLTHDLSGDPALDGAILYQIGLIQMADRRDDDALKTFDILWESGARLAVGVHAHAELLASKGQSERAMQILSEFEATVGTNASLSNLRMRIAKNADIRPARMSATEGAALAIYVPAAALMSQTSDDLSGVYFVLALALDKDLHVARALWAQSLDNANRRDEAIAVLREIPKSSEFYATAQGQMAWALRREERNAEALDVAATALGAEGDRSLKIQLADLYRSLDRLSEADVLLTKIIDADLEAGRSDWRLLFARGTAREQLGLWDSAELDLRAALIEQPENATILNYLGYSYVSRGLNLTEGFELIRKAAYREPRSGFIIDSLGWAHYQLGEYEQAVVYLERAVELEPGDAELNDHLGDGYWQVGRKIEARFRWQRAVKLMPEGDEREAVFQKITSGLLMPDQRSTEAVVHNAPIVSINP